MERLILICQRNNEDINRRYSKRYGFNLAYEHRQGFVLDAITDTPVGSDINSFFSWHNHKFTPFRLRIKYGDR